MQAQMKAMQEAMARPEVQQEMAAMQAYMQNQQVQERMKVRVSECVWDARVCVRMCGGCHCCG
jgi:hypothetical protein